MLTKLALLIALGAVPFTPGQEAKIKKIEGRLMAPCCYTQTILDHNSQVAADMRDEVAAMVAAGKKRTGDYQLLQSQVR